MISRRIGASAAVAATAVLAGAPAASAHVQVTPAIAAPGDGVLFTALVPNERKVATTAVELKIPSGMLPYGIEDPAGWKHRTILAADQSIDRIRWTGKLPAGGFVRLSLLASTPDQPGTIDWKALQTYADGQVVRWIGAPDSESPASRTLISASAPKQGAGGEIVAPDQPSIAASAAPRAVAAQKPDWVARGLAGAALAVALLAAALAATRRKNRETTT